MAEVVPRSATSMDLRPEVKLIREWILNDIDFKGRSDDEFILTFLHGCKFNLDKTKLKIKRYHENSIKIPQWWSNRDPMDDNLKEIAQFRMAFLIKPDDEKLPLIAISRMSRLGENSSLYNDVVKYMSLLADVAINTTCCQNNGFVGIADMKDTPYWFLLRMASPLQVKHFVTSFYFALPVRIKCIHFLHANYMVRIFWKILQAFLPDKIKKRIYVHGSDWKSKLAYSIPIELLPEEMGGQGGPLQKYTDMTNDDIMKRRQYFLDEAKYGFLSD